MAAKRVFEKTVYDVVKPFWYGPNFYEAGSQISLTEAEAKYRGDEIALPASRKPTPRRPAAATPAEAPPGDDA